MKEVFFVELLSRVAAENAFSYFKAGELILTEEAAVGGPANKTKPVCVKCLNGWTKEGGSTCVKCGWPVCDMCPFLDSCQHEIECEVLAKCPHQIRPV